VINLGPSIPLIRLAPPNDTAVQRQAGEGAKRRLNRLDLLGEEVTKPDRDTVRPRGFGHVVDGAVGGMEDVNQRTRVPDGWSALVDSPAVVVLRRMKETNDSHTRVLSEFAHTSC
jgi:hypothetical protein